MPSDAHLDDERTRLAQALTPDVYRTAEKAWDDAYADSLRVYDEHHECLRRAHEAWREVLLDALAAAPQSRETPDVGHLCRCPCGCDGRRLGPNPVCMACEVRDDCRTRRRTEPLAPPRED